LGAEQKNRKKIRIGALILGLSLLSSIEYGIIAIMSALAYFLFKKTEFMVFYSFVRESFRNGKHNCCSIFALSMEKSSFE
jgi:hypothetical protein